MRGLSVKSHITAYAVTPGKSSTKKRNKVLEKHRRYFSTTSVQSSGKTCVNLPDLQEWQTKLDPERFRILRRRGGNFAWKRGGFFSRGEK